MPWILEKLTDNIDKSGQDKALIALIALVDILVSSVDTLEKSFTV